MGGLKRKIPTDEKIEKKESKSVAFSKRRKGLYSKASQLCVLSGAQVAILATPPCSKSNVSFYSFGHSSVDSVVSAFLKNQYPRGEHLGESEYWWEDKRLAESEDPKELSEVVESISRMMQNLKGTLRSKALANREDAKQKKKEVVVDQSQTLNLQSACASSSCVHENQPENLLGHVKNIKEEDQKVAVSDNNNKELDQTLGFQSCFASNYIRDVSPENVEGVVNSSDEQKDQIVASSDSINKSNGLLGNLDGFDQVLNLDDDDDFFNFQGLVENFKEDNHIVDDNKDVVVTDGNQTLGGCIQDVSPENVEVFVDNSEQKDQTVASSNSSSNNNSNGLLGNFDGFGQVLTLDDNDFIDFEMSSEGLITTNGYSCGGSGSEDGAMVVVIPTDSIKDNQMVAAVSDRDNALPGKLYGCNQEFDIDQIFDFVTSTEDLSIHEL